MLNIKKLHDYIIQERIERYMKNMNLIQSGLSKKSGIDGSALNKILGKKVEKRFLLSYTNLEDLSRALDIDKIELLWGKEIEIESFIKIIILSLLINDDKLSLYQIEKTLKFSDVEIEPFTNSNCVRVYSLVENIYDDSYSEISDELTKAINHLNINYQTKIAINKNKHTQDKLNSSSKINVIDITDENFIIKFEHFWDKHKKIFISYFKSNYIYINDNNKNIMKNLTNDNFHKGFTSLEFLTLINKVKKEEFDTMQSLNYRILTNVKRKLSKLSNSGI